MWQAESEKLVDYLFEWGTDEQYSSGSVVPPGDLESHLYSVVLNDLTSGTRYYYRISASREEFLGDFISPSTETADLVFYALGDTRSGTATHDLIAGSILSQIETEPATQTFMISTGDLMDFADEQNLQENEFSPQHSRIRSLLASLPVVNVLGNHDDITLFKKYFPYPYTRTYDWSFDYGPLHVTVINQYNTLSPGTDRWIRLRDDLTFSDKPWKVIALHEPGWSAGPHENNQTVQEVIQALAEEYGVSLIIAGHNHYYARAEVNGVVHLTTGGGGAPLYDPENNWPRVEKTIKAYHYVKLVITGNTMKIQAHSPQGEILDEFLLIKQENK